MKRLLSMILALLILSSCSIVAFADIIDTAKCSAGTDILQSFDEPTRQEETEWYFRIYLGRRQMRLWSITYERWLTDWIDVGPA